MAISGVWIGLIAGLFTICVVELIFVWRIDWEKERKLAQERSEKSEDKSKLISSDEEYSVVPTENPEEMEVLSTAQTS